MTAQVAERATILVSVRTLLPPQLASRVLSAGVQGDRLTLGVAGAVWASRVRYLAGAKRARLSALTDTAVVQIRVRVVPPLDRT